MEYLVFFLYYKKGSSMQTFDIKHEIIIRFIKMLDIGYITVIYFILGYMVAITMDYHLGDFNKEKADKQSLFRVMLELLLQIWVFGMLLYIARNIVELIPSPFNSLYGFDHKKVRELGQATVFSLVLVWNSYNFRNRMAYVYNRIMGDLKRS